MRPSIKTVKFMTIEARSVSKKKSTMGKAPTNQVALTSSVKPAPGSPVAVTPDNDAPREVEINLGC